MELIGPEGEQTLGEVKSKRKAKAAPGSEKAKKKQAAPPLAKRKGPRKRFTTQVTVRVEDNLLTISRNHVEANGLTLTDAVEDALWDYLKKHGKSVPLTTRSGRFIWNVIPLDLQRLTLRFWAFMWRELDIPKEEKTRKFVEDLVRLLPDEWVQEQIEQLTLRYHRPVQKDQELPHNPVLASKDAERMY
jgi:hypothetical protein